MSLFCKFRGHAPDRTGARHDGQDYWTLCKRCGATLIRVDHRWREPTDEETLAHATHVDERQALSDDAGLNRSAS